METEGDGKRRKEDRKRGMGEIREYLNREDGFEMKSKRS